MVLTQDIVDKNFDRFAEAATNGTDEGYVLEINGLNAVDPLLAVQMMRKITYVEKATFVKKLILKRNVIISLFGEPIIDFNLNTEEAEFYAYKEFKENPTALAFLISAVYSEFLKNSVPQLSDSQEAARMALIQHKLAQLKGDSEGSSTDTSTAKP